MFHEIAENRFRHHLRDRFFRSVSFFCQFLGSNSGPRLGTLDRLSADFRDFLANFGAPCAFSSLEGARGECWDRFWRSRGSPWRSRGSPWDGFKQDFGPFSASLRTFVASQFCSNLVLSLSKFQIRCCSAVGFGLGVGELRVAVS